MFFKYIIIVQLIIAFFFIFSRWKLYGNLEFD